MFGSVLFLLLLRVPDPHTVTFKQAGEVELKMDVYAPAGAITSPCIVVVHGGSWMAGKREDMAPFCSAIALAGMTAVTVDYRLAPASKWPAMIEDVQDAVRYVRGHAKELNIDPEAVGAAGASAGGHLSLLLGTIDGWPDGNSKGKTSSKVSAVLNLFGPTDLTQDFPLALATVLSQQILGKQLVDAAQDIKAFSPITYVTADDAPVFTVQGKADPLVPFKQAERLDKMLADKSVKHKTVLIEGMKHGIDPKDEAQVAAVKDGIAFLQSVLTQRKD